jgi:hypothetical protein
MSQEFVEALRIILRIDVSFADAVRLVAIALETLAKRILLIPWQHVVEADHAVMKRDLTAEQCSPRSDAGWRLGNGVRKVMAGHCHGIDSRRMNARMTGDAERVRTMLIGRNEDYIRIFRIRHGGEYATSS